MASVGAMPPACRPAAMRCADGRRAAGGAKSFTIRANGGDHRCFVPLGEYFPIWTTLVFAPKTPFARHMQSPTPWTTGGTRGGAKDASFEVKVQAVILTWRQLADGTKRMAAYLYAAEQTGKHPDTVHG